MNWKQIGMSTLGVVLFILLLLLLLGAFPVWPYTATWGYGPTSVLGVLLIVVVVLLLLGKL